MTEYEITFERTRSVNSYWKACPFCGSPNINMGEAEENWRVFCMNCGTDGPIAKFRESEEQTRVAALVLWNRRA